MSRKFHVTVELEMPEDQTVEDAETWMASVLDCAFKKKNPVPCPDKLSDRIGWKPEISVPSSEHPYRPRVFGASEVAQPAPRPRRT